MLDGPIRRRIDPTVDRLGHWLAARGCGADQMTLLGGGLGIAAAIGIAMGAFWIAFALFLAGRITDGLDGAVARATMPTDRGGYLDIVMDFAVYAAIPLAFAWHNPATNALAAATLMAAIICNGAAFLAFAVMAAKRGLKTTAQGHKSLYFVAGLAEGTETILVYGAMCLWPHHFSALAWAFALLCIASAMARVAVALQRLA